ncbi:hypothetical protein CEXT_492271 [Caerostris extrusa]|uniref:Uncharacterized protein n=1 Tax=Caerostris extrusa TaxID=172846 RepID=A0AAV4TTK3_CAEEX|nr:hypothetical protein CEXT_492271 [Caerostris extrusa]
MEWRLTWPRSVPVQDNNENFTKVQKKSSTFKSSFMNEAVAYGKEWRNLRYFKLLLKSNSAFMLGIEPKSRRMYGIYLQRHYFTSAVWHLGGSSDPGNHSSFTGRHLTGEQVFPLEDIDLKLSYPGDQRFLFDQEKRRIK